MVIHHRPLTFFFSKHLFGGCWILGKQQKLLEMQVKLPNTSYCNSRDILILMQYSWNLYPPRPKPRVCPGEKPIASLIDIISRHVCEWGFLIICLTSSDTIQTLPDTLRHHPDILETPLFYCNLIICDFHSVGSVSPLSSPGVWLGLLDGWLGSPDGRREDAQGERWGRSW